MRRIRPGKLLLMLFLLAFAVFWGLDLAAGGLERVQGPADQAGKPAAVAHQPQPRTGSAAAGGSSTTSAPAGTGKGGATAAAAAPNAAAVKPQNTAAGSAVSPAAGAKAAASAEPRIEVKESFLNHLSNRIGDALHRAAKALIGLVVSIFDSLIS